MYTHTYTYICIHTSAALWIQDLSAQHLTDVETKHLLHTSRAPGLLSRLTADGNSSSESGDSSGGGGSVGSDVHPCTLEVLRAMTQRYRHLCGVWLAMSDAELRLVIALALLADGCAALAAQILLPLRPSIPGVSSEKRSQTPMSVIAERDSAESRVEAVCISVCLAQVAELIRAEGTRHSSTGHNQVDLSRFHQRLQQLVGALQLDIQGVTPLLVRFALCRGFWRLGHALVTGLWQGSNTSVSKHMCVAVCCSVLQCVAVCCSVLQCVAVCCRGRIRR